MLDEQLMLDEIQDTVSFFLWYAGRVLRPLTSRCLHTLERGALMHALKAATAVLFLRLLAW